MGKNCYWYSGCYCIDADVVPSVHRIATEVI